MLKSERYDVPQLSDDESLIVIFHEQEAYDSIMQVEKIKTTRPYGFPNEFYQKFKDMWKWDLYLRRFRRVTYTLVPP
jgi:hypothetical protein